MSNKPFIKLGESEAAILQAAATIYASYVSSDTSNPSADANERLEQAAREAVFLAKAIDKNIIADGEMG